MSTRIVVAGTDTGLGKTVLSAALTAALDGCYWKPVQAGTIGGTDSERVKLLTGLGAERILPEAYQLRAACSPHLAAELEGIEIDPVRLAIPETERPLVIELAGGLMVPLKRNLLQIDVVAGWQTPVVLAARTALGTINHTLLSLEALRRRNVPVIGVAFIGDENADTARTIGEIGGVKLLGRLPIVARIDRERLREAFAANFQLAGFTSGETSP
ncbi:MAG: dethiobiotin synthase [Pseudomonadota bacterium]